MQKIEYSGQFKKDLKRVKKQDRDMENLKIVMRLLIEGKALPEKYCDHLLKGNWRGCRDLHIEPDWLLIYRLNDDVLRFERSGSHSDLF